MKVSTSITSSLVAIIATLSSHSVHVNGELRFLKPDNKQCTTPCDCFVEIGVRGESKQQIATCKIFVGEGAGVNECRNQCVGPVEAAKLIANKGATVSQLLIFSHTM